MSGHSEPPLPPDSPGRPEDLQKRIEGALETRLGPKAARFVLECLGGVPVIGGMFGASAGAWSEAEQSEVNKILAAWLKLQQDELKEIGLTLKEVLLRLEVNDPEIQERLKSPEYLSIVKKCFRDWAAAESEMKRVLVRNLLTHAAASRICTDDVVKLFIEWIGQYSEIHFAVIKAIFAKPGRTRRQIWAEVYGKPEREDSAEADLFRLIIHDLSTGRVIRQHREKDYSGRYLKQQASGRRGSGSPYMTSSFDDEKPYELTELGKQFVHYTMDEVVPRLAAPAGGQTGSTASSE